LPIIASLKDERDEIDEKDIKAEQLMLEQPISQCTTLTSKPFQHAFHDLHYRSDSLGEEVLLCFPEVRLQARALYHRDG